MAKKVKNTNGCYVVPAFTGLGAPYWDQYARGTIVGLTRGVNKYHIIRATLESLAYQAYDVLTAMKADSDINLASLKVDGGASANNFLMQTQADLINAPVHRPVCVETTAMGAAYLAGLAVGYWKSLEEIKENWAIDQIFEPSIDPEIREKKLKGWHKAVKYSFDWAKESSTLATRSNPWKSCCPSVVHESRKQQFRQQLFIFHILLFYLQLIKTFLESLSKHLTRLSKHYKGRVIYLINCIFHKIRF